MMGPALAAAVEDFGQISRGLSQGLKANDAATRIMVGLIIALCAVLVILMIGRHVKAVYERYRPTVMFLRIAKSLGVGFVDRFWLLRIARSERLDSPISLLLSPTTLQHHARRHLKTLPKSEARQMNLRLSGLMIQLFGPDAPPNPVGT